MGLDMYAYRIKKASDLDIKYLVENGVPGNGVVFLKKKGIEEDPGRYADLERYLTPASYIDKEDLDMSKIRKAFDIPEDASVGMIDRSSASKIVFAFYFKPENEEKNIRKEVTILQEDLDKYGMTEPYEGYIFKYEEVGYWRKAYELQEKIYNAYEGSIENCGWHKCNPEMIEAMLEYDEMTDDDYRRGSTDGSFDEDSEDIFYYEWY